MVADEPCDPAGGESEVSRKLQAILVLLLKVSRLFDSTLTNRFIVVPVSLFQLEPFITA